MASKEETTSPSRDNLTTLSKKEISALKKKVFGNRHSSFFFSSSDDESNTNAIKTKTNSPRLPFTTTPPPPPPPQQLTKSPNTSTLLLAHSPDSFPPTQSIESDEDSLPGLVSAKPSPPPDFSRQSSPPRSNPIPIPTLTFSESVSPKTFKSSAFIQMKPIIRPKPMKPIKFKQIDSNEVVVEESSFSTKKITTPRATITTQHSSYTTTIKVLHDDE